jgi:hypothetical protein
VAGAATAEDAAASATATAALAAVAETADVAAPETAALAAITTAARAEIPVPATKAVHAMKALPVTKAAPRASTTTAVPLQRPTPRKPAAVMRVGTRSSNKLRSRNAAERRRFSWNAALPAAQAKAASRRFLRVLLICHVGSKE